MRILRLFVVVTAFLGLLVIPAAGAQAVPQHLHCVTTPNGNTHSIARGVTFMAPNDPALENFHQHVHLGAFVKNPIQLAADLTDPFTCPPSP